MAWQTKAKKVGGLIANPCLRLLTIFVVLVSISIPGVYIYNSPPDQSNFNAVNIDYSHPFNPNSTGWYIYDKGFDYNVLIDTHAHTYVGGAQMSPETSLEWHIACGYNAVVITDHNDIDTAFETQQVAREKYNDKIKVIVGEEWTNCRMHMNMLGLKKYIPTTKTPTDEEIQAVINETHAQGGVVVVNHLAFNFWVGFDTPSKEQFVAWGVDYFDVATEGFIDFQTLLWARAHDAGVVAATDIHGIVAAHAWTLLKVPDGNITEDSILDALRTRKTSFIFDAIGYYPPTSQAEIPPNKSYQFLFPWILVGELIHSFFYMTGNGMYSFVDGFCGSDTAQLVILKSEIAISLLWLIFMWALFELVFGSFYAVYKMIDQKRNPRKYRRVGTLNADYDEDISNEMWSK